MDMNEITDLLAHQQSQLINEWVHINLIRLDHACQPVCACNVMQLRPHARYRNTTESI